MDSFSVATESAYHGALRELARRCLTEPASRRLDGEIYCALHNIRDANPPGTSSQVPCGEAGEVLVEHQPGAGFAWIEVPPFTTQLKYAESLLPDGLATIYRDARTVCATALLARVLANEPPPSVSGIADREHPGLPLTLG
jgi:hypothetical protein